jgi:hypothetical protein
MTPMNCGECRASSNAAGQAGEVLIYRRKRAVRRYSRGGGKFSVLVDGSGNEIAITL